MSKKYYVNQNTNRIRKTKFNDSDIYKNLNKKNFTYNKNYSQTEKEIDKSFVNENLKENKKSFKSSFLGWIKSIFIFIFTTLLGLLIISVYLALTHPLFNIDLIEVSGNINNESTQIIEKSGVAVGNNIFWVNSKKIANRIKELKGIEEVKVEKLLPNILRIKVKENYNLAYIKKDDENYIIDLTGKIVKKASNSKELEKLIKIEGFPLKNTGTGEVFTDKKIFIDFYNKLKEYPYLKEISKITMDSKDEMKIFLIDGLEISFGKLVKIEDKLNAIDRILLDIKAKNIQAVELILDVGDNPIVVTEDN